MLPAVAGRCHAARRERRVAPVAPGNGPDNPATSAGRGEVGGAQEARDVAEGIARSFEPAENGAMARATAAPRAPLRATPGLLAWLRAPAFQRIITHPAKRALFRKWF